MNSIEQQHWDEVYDLKTENGVSWFQEYPKTSMDFLNLITLPLDANIIDVGGGDSRFVDALIEKGYHNIWVLNISKMAIHKAKKRLGKKAEKVTWIVSDTTKYVPTLQFNFWHDRAAFHFLTSENKYIHINCKGCR